MGRPLLHLQATPFAPSTGPLSPELHISPFFLLPPARGPLFEALPIAATTKRSTNLGTCAFAHLKPKNSSGWVGGGRETRENEMACDAEIDEQF